MPKIYCIRNEAEKVAKHFIIAALWANSEEGTNPRISAQAKRAAFNICHTFMCRNGALFAQAMDREVDGYGAHPDCGNEGPAGAFGHDLWLTLLGHGCGFWDRDALDAGGLGESLTEACHKFGEPEYWQANGWFYISETFIKE